MGSGQRYHPSHVQEHRKRLLHEALPEGPYKKAHLPGALNLPPDRIQDLAPSLLPNRDADILNCSSPPCGKSSAATATLLEMGFRNAEDYEGGKKDWSDAGLPTERSGLRGARTSHP